MKVLFPPEASRKNFSWKTSPFNQEQLDNAKLLFGEFFCCFLISGIDWNEPRAENCLRQSQPVEGSVYPGGTHPGEEIVKSVLSKMRKPVYLLDITLLTQLRKDCHPSLYTGSGLLLKDCSPWCLAGVPDTWNQLLYTALVGQ
ncbi:Protein trichome birefringence-like 37 [Ancistrocladus abbreviatus]